MANDTQIHVKEELLDPSRVPKRNTSAPPIRPISLIELSDSDSDSSSSGDDNVRKKRRTTENAVLPLGFLDPLPLHSSEHLPLALPSTTPNAVVSSFARQFWKAGDYDDAPSGDWEYSNGGMDHVRVHPRFLHSNATSHKWALGAFAELLDNSLDEVCNGATYVNIDMVKSKKDGSKMLLIEGIHRKASHTLAFKVYRINIDMVKSKKDGSKMLLIEGIHRTASHTLAFKGYLIFG